MTRVLPNDVVVKTPEVLGELIVTGFDDSVSSDEIKNKLAQLSGGSDLKIKTGTIRYMSNGLCMLWVQLPLANAVKVANLERFRIGWTVARVRLLKARPLQCYKCWSFGHVTAQCQATTNHTGHCFRCGEAGHTARTCANSPKCAICADLGSDSYHRIGSAKCMSNQKDKVSVKKKKKPTLSIPKAQTNDSRGRESMDVDKQDQK